MEKIGPFVHQSAPGRVVFGAGSLARLPDELGRLGVARALLIYSPSQRAAAERAAELPGARAAGLYGDVAMHVPAEAAEAARAEARRLGADGCVAIGGGSAVGLAKAIALSDGLPILAVPTTYAGSEMTPIWGVTEGGRKRTGRDPRVLPRAVIYDVELTLGLPARVAGPSGVNALAHCAEALYAPDGSPVVSLLAEEGARALAASLPAVVASPGDVAAREGALYGAWLAGASLGAASMGLHHKLCHTLGGAFGLPHAEVHAAVLPHAAAYNAPAAPAAMARLARALGAADAPRGLWDLARAVGAPASLRELGMPEAELGRAAELAARDPYANPAPVTREGLLALLRAAFEGHPPEPAI